MSTVLEALDTRHVTGVVTKVTQDLTKTRHDVYWRYDLLSSRRFPVQYYATALRGVGPEVDEIVVTGIECFESSDGHLVVSAMITGEDGAILAQGPSFEIDMPSKKSIAGNCEAATLATNAQIQVAVDLEGDWVSAQRQIIRDALAQSRLPMERAERQGSPGTV